MLYRGSPLTLVVSTWVPGVRAPASVMPGSTVVKNSPNSLVDVDPTSAQPAWPEMLIVTRCRGGKAKPWTWNGAVGLPSVGRRLIHGALVADDDAVSGGDAVAPAPSRLLQFRPA